PAFHPRAAQDVLPLPEDGLLGFVRTARSGERLAVIANLSSEPRTVDSGLIDEDLRYDELALERLFKDEDIPMRPFQVRWLTAN
ncbi:MAG: sugar phosphorylase, partial [Rubripirellula sp.]